MSFTHQPKAGTRVIENLNHFGTLHLKLLGPRQGSIINVYGTSISVLWDDGSESHNLWCGKKGNEELLYL